MAEQDNKWVIRIDKFYQGFAPLAFNNSLTEQGSAGNASTMSNCDVLNGDYLSQGPGLANLTNGTQASAVSEPINFIQDKAVADSVAYAVGSTKLYKLTPSSVVSDATWPQSITNCTQGSSVVDLKGNLYVLYNKSSGGDIAKMPLSGSTIDPDWGSTVPTGAAALQSAIHPVCAKEDIMLFGNGQYAGVYFSTSNTLNATKLDFGSGFEVADVLFNANQWYIAVNSGVSGTNRSEGQIYTYDGAALSNQLSDEAGVGVQRIGFLYRLNGVIFVAYRDVSATGFVIGYVNGSQIKPLARYSGDLPTYAQKTLYKNAILFLSSGLAYSAGAFVDTLPFQLSQIADGGYATATAIAAPFGTPMVASYSGSNYRIAKFSGYETDSSWKSIIFPVSNGRYKGFIDSVTVLTNNLGTGAKCAVTVKADQETLTGSAQTVSSGRKHIFQNIGLGPVEDFSVSVSFSSGSASNPCNIRSIVVNGHYVEN